MFGRIVYALIVPSAIVVNGPQILCCPSARNKNHKHCRDSHPHLVENMKTSVENDRCHNMDPHWLPSSMKLCVRIRNKY